MRIAYLLPAEYAIGNPGNGVTAQARAQAAAMARRGHDVIYLNPWDLQLEEEIDVLHFFMGGMALYGIESGRRLPPTGVIVMSPILDTNKAFGLYRFAAQLGSVLPRMHSVPAILAAQARGSDVVICRSQAERERVIGTLGVSPACAAVVLNGIDSPEPCQQSMSEVKRRYELPDRFVLHISGYTDPRKNVLRLAAAAEQLGLPLVIAGHAMPGPIENELRNSCQRNGHLRLLGFVDRRTRDALYGLCHVFCLPSHHEGTGLAALEAGAAGAHVVITRMGGTHDYFKEHAFYVSPTDLNGIRQMLARAWDAPRGDALRTHIHTSLGWDASASALERAYDTARSRKVAAIA
jgi:glycosyltransferase involved in cell wall biosynthesis